MAPEQALTCALKKREPRAARIAVANGADVNVILPVGNTALLIAIITEDECMVEELLSMPAIEVNRRGTHSLTPLHCAARVGHTRIVRLLLKMAGIDVNARDALGCTPLMVAAHFGHTHIVQLLLCVKDIDAGAANAVGDTALIRASHEGKVAVVRALLGHGVDASHENKKGFTAMLYAAFRGDTDVVRLLLAVEEDYSTIQVAFFAAAKSGHIGTTKLLMHAPNVCLDHIWSAIYQAYVSGHHQLVRCVVIQLGSRIHEELRPLFNTTALGYNALAGYVGIMRLLVDLGVDVNRGECPPIVMAVTGKQLEVVRCLLATPGIEVNAHERTSGTTALHVACYLNLVEIVDELLAAPGIMVNVTDTDSYTPLTQAAVRGHTSCVVRLLADPRLETEGVDLAAVFEQWELTYTMTKMRVMCGSADRAILTRKRRSLEEVVVHSVWSKMTSDLFAELAMAVLL